MKKREDIINRLYGLIRSIEDGMHEMESESLRLEDQRNEIMIQAEFLLRLSRKGPAYIEERAGRLRETLRTLMRQEGYSDRKYERIYRQLDRMRETEVSDFVSPLIRESMDRIYRSRLKPAFRTGPDTLTIYRLGTILFGWRGPIRAKRKSDKPVRFDGEFLPLFPRHPHVFTRSEALPPQVLVAESKSGRRYGLWCDKVLQITSYDPLFDAETELLGIKSDAVQGRIRRNGREIYLVNF